VSKSSEFGQNASILCRASRSAEFYRAVLARFLREFGTSHTRDAIEVSYPRDNYAACFIGVVS
jgi:hypothetical protein